MLSALPQKILHRISNKFVSPQALLAEIGVQPGQSILELGSPIGFFAHAALEAVGPQGSVYAAGPTPESLESLDHFKHRENFRPVLLRDIVQGKTVPLHAIDVVILTNLLSNAIHPGDFCISIVQYLKPGSEVVLMDWDSQDESVGPSKSQRVTREAAIKLLSQCGLEFTRVLKTPGYHYGVVFHATGQADLKSGNLDA